MTEQPQTFSESWYRIATRRISLRPDVHVRRQNFRGERWIILENPFSNQFFRLRPAAYEFVGRLRPDRTVEEVWKECLQKFPDTAPGQESVIQLLSQLYMANLLHYDQAADTAKLFERYRKTRQRETQARLLNVMFMRIPLLDPDRFLVKTLPVIGKLISPIGALIWAVVVVAGIKVAIDHWPELWRQTQGVLAPGNLFLLYSGLVIIKTLHEFGHAYFCRRFGGEVHVMGIMLMIFTPIPYMDATSSWGFQSRWKRCLVGAAGMIVELFVAALAVFVWAGTGPGTIHSLAYNMIFVASISTVVFNINPLLRFDGYYILSDLLEIPNLHQRALKQLGYLWERYVFGLKKVESPARTIREAAWLVSFGILSMIYRIFVFGSILLLIADRFLILGILMAVICLISWVLVPIVKLIKYLASAPQLDRHRPRALAVMGALAAVLVLLLQVIPFPHHFRAPGVVQAQEWNEVMTETAGRVARLLVEPGSRVIAGQPLIELENPELELELAATRARHEEVSARLRQAMREETANLKPLQSVLESALQQIARLEKELAALTIRSRHDGIWIAPGVKSRVGSWLLRGTSLGMVVNPAGFEFNATVPQEDGDRLFSRPITEAEIRLFGQVGQVVPAKSLRIIPAEQHNLPSAALGWHAGGDIPVAADDPYGTQVVEPFFKVQAELADSRDAVLLHGQSGRIRFDLGSEPLLPRWIRRLRQLLQKRYQL